MLLARDPAALAAPELQLAAEPEPERTPEATPGRCGPTPTTTCCRCSRASSFFDAAHRALSTSFSLGFIVAISSAGFTSMPPGGMDPPTPPTDAWVPASL